MLGGRRGLLVERDGASGCGVFDGSGLVALSTTTQLRVHFVGFFPFVVEFGRAPNCGWSGFISNLVVGNPTVEATND
jgi:hypothetical protein